MSESRSLPREPQPSDIFLKGGHTGENAALRALFEIHSDTEIANLFPSLDIQSIMTLRSKLEVSGDVGSKEKSSPWWKWW